MKKFVTMAMNPQLTWLKPLLLLFLFLFLFTVFSATPASSSASSLSYSDHCSSIVPDSIPTDPDYTIYPHLSTLHSHYSGGDRLLGNTTSSEFSLYPQKYVSFEPTQHIFRTIANGVYKIKANLLFQSSESYYSGGGRSYYGSRSHRRSGSVKFELNGFWSELTGKLCMVGSASWYSNEDQLLNLDAVLKLNYFMNSTITNSLIQGGLKSLSSLTDPSYFEPVSIWAFAETSNYKYTLTSGESGCHGGIDFPKIQSLPLLPRKFCSAQRRINLLLKYTNECSSSKNCSLLDQGIDYLPRAMAMNSIQCSEDERKVRYLIQFENGSYVNYGQPFDPNKTLVAEGSWDEKRNQLCIVACRILKNARVGDCSIRMSLRYPALWSIRNRAGIVGQIWTNKTVNELGYFNKIMFGSYENRMVGVSGLKYEYTQMDRVTNSCPMKKNKPGKSKGERFPEANSYDMRLNMRLKDSKGKIAQGYSLPVFVGDQSYDENGVVVIRSRFDESEVEEAKSSYGGPLNISYAISIYGSFFSTNFSSIPGIGMEISAEGVYDEETGSLCMVGCRELSEEVQRSAKESVDCELLVKVQYQPINAQNRGTIKGSIESMRKKTDPLYFAQLDMSASAYYTEDARNSIWRMDLEIAMVLISNTLACVFVGLQILYVKKNPGVLPLASLVMLVVLVLGYMIPLVLNFEAMFFGKPDRQNEFLGGGGWLEVNEVIVRVVTMVAFLLQFRLLQLAWSARLGGENNQKALWVAEKKSLFVSLPLYIVGVLVVLFLNLGKNKYNQPMLSRYAVSVAHQQQQSLWGALKSYGGLVLDGFLFPQILLNMFRISGENALSCSFYIGTTFVRLLPHAYDLYRAHSYTPDQFEGSYIYASPSADYYSTAWDIVISCGGVAFAVIIYLQQRFGGRCILPRRFREAAVYEKVPVVSSE